MDISIMFSKQFDYVTLGNDSKLSLQRSKMLLILNVAMKCGTKNSQLKYIDAIQLTILRRQLRENRRERSELSVTVREF